MKITETLNNLIRAALKEAAVESVDFTLEHPAEVEHGDFATNAAMIAAKASGQNPREIAQRIADYLNEHKPDEVERIEVAGPGFVNFFLSQAFFTKSTERILENAESYGKSDRLKGEKVMVEYTDPNAFKAFHIGHLMSNTIGEAISRVIEWNGADVKRACYASDIGLNTAKAVWGMRTMSDKQPEEGEPLIRKVQFLQAAYVEGNTKYEEDERAKAEIDDINKKLFEKSDADLNDLYLMGRRWSLEHFEEIYRVLGTNFAHYFYESEVFETGMRMVFEGAAKGVFQKSEGAIVYNGERYGLHTRVFVNSEGLPTYEAKELGLNRQKFDREPELSRSIIITAEEQKTYFEVVLKALSEIAPEIAEKTDHVSHGMMRLSSGKMSSRKGNIITAEDLIADARSEAYERMNDRGFNEEKRTALAEDIAVSALKYSVLKQTPGKNITFDFSRAFSFEGDSGPYLQYSYVRARSVLAKAESEGVAASTAESANPQGWLTTYLEKLLYRFPEAVESAYREYSPNIVANYLVQLSAAFNTYYAKEKIVDKDDPHSPYKVALTEAFANVMKNGLYIMAIEAPEEM